MATVEHAGTADRDTTASHRPRKLAHIVLRTRENFEPMVDWYSQVLSARIVYRSERIAFLTYDDEHHRIAIARSPELADRPHRAVGLDHVAFTYDALQELLETWERLEATGITPFLNVNHGPTTSLYYHDPDGNRIELQVDNFEDMDDATSLMLDQYDVNPVGVEFDAGAMLEAVRNGRTAFDLIKPSATPAVPTAELIRKLRGS